MCYPPDVAVIMCVYRLDVPEQLEVSIKSILDQTVPCDLLIYQDGPVPEAVEKILKNYSICEHVHLFSGINNLGLAAGLNILIEFALRRGYKYLARMDSDDISYPERIQLQRDFLKANQFIDVVGTSCREFGSTFALKEKHLPTTHNALLDFSITRCPFIHPTVMFKSSVFLSGVRYPENTSLTEDMALWFDLLHRGFKFSNINLILLDYRLNGNTISRRKGMAKALNETMIRFYYMKLLKMYSLKNFILVSARLVFHLLPDSLVKLAYKLLR